MINSFITEHSISFVQVVACLENSTACAILLLASIYLSVITCIYYLYYCADNLFKLSTFIVC